MAKEFLLQTSFNLYDSFDRLDASDQLLVTSALAGAEKAYAPYSNFQVGAALRLQNGDIVFGNNQENAAYPSGLCAERVALFTCKSQYPDSIVEAIAVVARKGSENLPAHPCGSCRQTMLEYEIKQDTPIRVIMAFKNQSFLVANSVQDLLPLGFTRKDL